MKYTLWQICVVSTLFTFCITVGCNDGPSKKPAGNIVIEPGKMNDRARDLIEQNLRGAVDKSGKLDDSTFLPYYSVLNSYYDDRDYAAVWSDSEKWNPLTDSLLQLIKNGELYGLFPKEYHYAQIGALKKMLDTDSMKRRDVALWTRADLLFSDAFMHIIKDLKYGRLKPDSTTFSSDTSASADFYKNNLKDFLSKKQLSVLIDSLQPVNKGYLELKKGIRAFLDSMDRHVYTYVTFPYKSKDSADSVKFIKVFQKRLKESNCIDFTAPLPDTGQLRAAVKKYQKLKGVKQDGIISASLIRMINNTDIEKFKRIAITLDRYKMLPRRMPEKYIWVNLPGFYLQVWDSDTVVFNSKIICGKPATRTPLLTSYITDMITYPTWTVPNSIIVKQYLPKLKSNPNYLTRLGLHLVNSKGETVSPETVSWAKYSKGIPYKVMQGSGDDNALGVFKFNFNNPFAVYLHDTNQRYLFKNASRAYSHGCVRVQEWEKLAYFIVQNDSLHLPKSDTLKYNTDSIKNWIAAKQRKRIDVRTKLSLFIRYFTCEGKNGKIVFYEDIYGEDKAMREKYFKN